MTSHKFLIDKFLEARKKFARGPQKNYLNHWDIIGWTRLGDPAHPGSMAVIMSDGEGGEKWMDTGKPETAYIDMTGHRVEPVITNQDGWGEFAVNGGSVSVWVEHSSLAGEDREVDVVFTCHNGETFWGQNVYVVGSIPELGNWDTDKARILNPENHPDWGSTLSHLPPDTYIEWKCIKRDGAGNVEWQPGDNNKFTTAAGGTGMTSGSF